MGRRRRRLRLTSLLPAVGPIAAVLVAITFFATNLGARAAGEPYTNASLPINARVDDLLDRMSIDEKIGQMTQVERTELDVTADITRYRIGSLLSGGGSAPATNTPAGWAAMYDEYQQAALATPHRIPLIYGIDAVHGHNTVYGATVFPHNIGLGATRDPALVERIGRATADEVTATGLNWTFGPCLCVARDDRWGRTYESFGENPELVSQMSTIITGLQGATLGGQDSILATAKHYVGDGGTTGGVDQGDTAVSEAELRRIHLPPFQAAVQRGVGAVMVSFSSWNGKKVHANRYLITDLLKGELGFSGFVVSDYAGIDQIDGQRGFTRDEVAAAINAGIDMVMVPADYRAFTSALTTAVSTGQVTLARINDANRRILRKKFELGLFEHPYSNPSLADHVGSAEHRALARQAVRESQVLLKNTGILPLSPEGGKIFVAGRAADDIGMQAGGWTITWQGKTGPITPGTTILGGIRSTVGSKASVTYARDGTGIDSSYRVAIAVIGESPYAEGRGDRPGGLGLDPEDLATLDRLRTSGVPVVVVLVSGRPLEVTAQLPSWSALVAAWLPGTEGSGVADVLFGAYNPTGKLPVTWPRSSDQEPINSGDGKPSLFPYGYGLSYPPPAPHVVTSAPTTKRPTPTGTRVTCTVDYQVANSWTGGFQAFVTVRNTGPAPWDGWSLVWTFADGQTITQLWNGMVSTAGAIVTVHNAAWNGVLAPGTAALIGFTATAGASNTPPASFTVNGTRC